LKIEIDVSSKEQFNNYYFENNLEKYSSLSNKKFLLFENLSKTNLNLISQRKQFILYQFLALYLF